MVIGKYIRLSLEDKDLGDDKTVSNSIVHQRDLIQNFINAKPEFANCTQIEFFDDGYSGTNFDRPSFEKMMDRVRAGEIDCIIVKDFSRFGRDYIELGDYLERIFPFLGVRFISVNDGYDSNDYKGTTGGLEVVMKNIIYDYYSKDLSVKVTTAKKQKMKKGEYLGGHVPYGLKKHESIRGRLAIDPEAAAVVKEIFDLFLAGNPVLQIAHTLNDRGVDAPGAYYRKNHPGTKKFANTSSASQWTTENVRKVLRQEMYYGAVAGHRRENVCIGGKHTRAVPKEEQIIIEDMHDAIISKETFMEVQARFRPAYEKKHNRTTDYPLKGKVICGHCGRRMIYKSGMVRDTWYNYFGCTLAKYQNDCDSRYVREDELNQTVWNAIQSLTAYTDKAIAKAKSVKDETGCRASALAAEIGNLQKKLEKCNTDKFSNIEALMSGGIAEDVFKKRKAELNDLAAQLEKEIKEKEAVLHNLEMGGNTELDVAIDSLKEASEVKELTRKQVKALVKGVVVTGPEHIEIKWNFSEEVLRFITEE